MLKSLVPLPHLYFANSGAVPTEMVSTEVPQSQGTPSTSKSMNHVSLIPFIGNPHFSILLHRVRYLMKQTSAEFSLKSLNIRDLFSTQLDISYGTPFAKIVNSF